MNTRTIKSPVTGRKCADPEESVSASCIINAYSCIGIDVSAHFLDLKEVFIYRCSDTGYRFFAPCTLEADSTFYDLLNSKNGYYRLKEEHRLATLYIGSCSRVLEIGSGSGLFLESISPITTNSVGLETNLGAATTSRQRGIHTETLDIFEYADISTDGAFDVVCSFQVLEHVYDVKRFIDSALKVLKPGGYFIIGVPNNNPFLYRHDKFHALNLPPHHMGLWSIESLEALAGFFPLDIQNIRAERLSQGKLDYFFQIQRGYAEASSDTLRHLYYAGLLSIKPGRLRASIMKHASKKYDGRNLLAVYSKSNSPSKSCNSTRNTR